MHSIAQMNLRESRETFGGNRTLLSSSYSRHDKKMLLTPIYQIDAKKKEKKRET
jgi:hypothetical protein